MKRRAKLTTTLIYAPFYMNLLSMLCINSAVHIYAKRTNAAVPLERENASKAPELANLSYAQRFEGSGSSIVLTIGSIVGFKKNLSERQTTGRWCKQ